MTTYTQRLEDALDKLSGYSYDLPYGVYETVVKTLETMHRLLKEGATDEELDLFHDRVRIECDPANKSARILNDKEVLQAMLNKAVEG